MHKVITTLLASFCLASLLFITRSTTLTEASTNTIYVKSGDSIQDAINNASDGDLIYVNTGIYSRVVVNKSVSIIGESRDSTIIDGGGTGIVVLIEANNVSIRGFTIRNSGQRPLGHGVSIAFGSSNFIGSNKIESNYMGIYLYSSHDNVISGNIIALNERTGIHLLYASNNIIRGNTISSNNYGIFLSQSNDNIIYHNNFDNILNAWDEAWNEVLPINIWNYDKEGNYWSDYDGTDYIEAFQNESHSDGIGDTPYTIDAYNQDNYPLMGEFVDFYVTLKSEEYYFAVISNSTISSIEFVVGAETGSKIVLISTIGEENTVGFCRPTIPSQLMQYPYIILIDNEETTPAVLNTSSETSMLLYFTYINTNQTITVISSETLRLYNQLLADYIELQIALANLNATQHEIAEDFQILLTNHTQLLESFHEMNSSYQAHLLSYAENAENSQSFMYIFAATTAIFLVTTVYLSKNAHVDNSTKIAVSKSEK